MAYRQGDNIYLSHELFPIPNNVKERIFPITVTGKRSGVDVIKTFLVKLANADYATAKLEYVDEDGKASVEPGGHVVFTWKDPDGHGTFGYNIHYYQYTDNYDPENLTDPDKTVESVKWVHPGDYIDNKDGSFSYHLTENTIYLRSNTEIKVVPVINRSGAEYVEEVGMATAQAELTFYGDPTAETGAYVSPTEKSKLLFKVINIGTAAATVKAKQDALGGNTNLLRIKVSEYLDEGRTQLKEGGEHTFDHNLDDEDVLPGDIITSEHEHLFPDRKVYYFRAEIDPSNWIYEKDADENNVCDYDIRAAYHGKLEIQQKEGGGYKAIFAPIQSLWDGGAQPGVTQQSPTHFEITYYDHGEYKTCRVANTGIKKVEKPEWGANVFEFDLPADVVHIDSDTPVTIAAVYDDGTSAVFADDTPFFQETEMDWTPITGADDGSGEPYDFTVANTTVNIEYKILDTSITDLHYKDIMTIKHGYAPTWLNMGISSRHADIIQNSFETGAVDGYAEDQRYSTTTFSFAQARAEYCNDYGNPANPVPALEIKPVRSANVMTPDGTFIPTEASAWEYVGNGINMNIEAFGLGRYYVAKIETKDKKFITIAWRVTTEEGEWYRVAGADQDKMPFYYHDESHIYNTAKYYYDARDWYLSSVSCYGGGHLTIQTDTAKSLNGYNPSTDVERPGVEPGEHWHIDVAQASLGSDGRVVEPESGYITYASGTGAVGRQGDGRLLVTMQPIMRDLVGHSDKGGTQDFFYLIRVYYDEVNHPEDYVAVPLLVRVDIPEIEALPEENINVSSGSKNLYVSFTETEDGAKNDYVYDIYLDGELVESRTDLPDGKRVSVPVPEERWTELNTDHSIFTIKIVSKWCYSKDQSDTKHWYADGSGELVNHYQSTETTYIYENEVDVGEVYVQGFQMNTNKEEGGISEFMPSMRVVSKAAERIKKNGTDTAYGVVSYGTIIAPSSGGAELNELSWSNQQDIENASSDSSLMVAEAVSPLKWTGADANKYNYYGVSLKNLLYKYSELETKYQFRAYAVLDDDDSSVVLSKETYEVDLFEVAQNLYENHQMGTKEGHEFLYDDILNIVAIHNNCLSIAQAMAKTLDITSTASDDYKLINKVYKDLYYYTEGSGGYTYQNRIETAEDGTVTKFVSKHITDEENTELLGKLNAVSDENNGDVGKQATLYDWIEANVGTLKGDTKDLTKYQGFYQTLDYQWDDNLYKVGSPVSGNSE